MPARYRIEWSVSQKEDLAISRQFTDSAKQPIDITGMVIVYKAKNGANVIEASTANGLITIDDAADGLWSMTIPKATLAAKPAGVYTHDMVNTEDGVTTEFFVGTLELRPGV